MQPSISHMHYTHSHLPELVLLRNYGPNLGPGTGSKTQVQMRDQQKELNEKSENASLWGFLEIH